MEKIKLTLMFLLLFICLGVVLSIGVAFLYPNFFVTTFGISLVASSLVAVLFFSQMGDKS